MKNYKLSTIGSLLAIVLVLIPVVSFAEGSNNQNKTDGVKNSSLWNKVSSLFGDHTIINNNLTPTITGITSPTVLNVGEVGTWEVKASDPENRPLSYMVSWGDENSISENLSKLSEKGFVQEATFTHAYNNAGKYKIRFIVQNDLGKRTTSTVTVFVKGQNINPVIIKNLKVQNIKTNKVTISWTTNVKTNSLVWYDTTSPVETSRKPNIFRNQNVFNHRIEINHLNPGTTYHLVVGSMKNGQLKTSEEISFKTKSIIGNLSPVITSLNGPESVLVGQSFEINVNAYDPRNQTLSYDIDWGENINEMTINSEKHFEQNTTFSHVYNTAGTYTVTLTVQNASGQKTTSTLKIEAKLSN